MNTGDRQHKPAYVYAMVAVGFWATSATAFKLSLGHVGQLPLLLFASVASTGVFLVYVVATGKLKLLCVFTAKDYLWSAGLGLLNPFLYYVILFKAYSLLPAQEAQPINFVWPLTLVLLSIPLLGQRIRLTSILAILVSFTGVVVIATHPAKPADILHFRFSSGPGVVLALGSTVIWALFWVVNTKDRQDEAVRLFVNFLFASAYIFIVVLLLGQTQVDNWRGLLGGIYIGLFEMGVTFLVWLKALKNAKTTAHVVNLIYLVPFLSLLVIALVLGERILPSTVVGLVFIVAGIVLQKAWA
jgi:drug/metabolite transporter (DMT)-like permease